MFKFKKTWLLKWSYHLLVIILFSLIAFILNRIPDGKFIAGGDFYQFIEPEKNLYKFGFLWNTSQTGSFASNFGIFPYYFFQFFLYKIGFTYSQIFSINFFGFLLLAFYSFYFSLKVLALKADELVKIAFSLLYSLNLFTFGIFNFTWSVTPHLSIYLFIPILFSLFYRILNKFNLVNFSWFVLIFTLSLTAYQNIAFFIGLIMLQFFLVLGCSVFSLSQKNPKEGLLNIKNFFLTLLVQAFLIATNFLSLYVSSIGSIGKLSNNKVFGDNFIDTFVRKTSSGVVNTVRLMKDYWDFPNIDQTYSNWWFVFAVLTLVPSGLIILNLFLKNKSQNSKIWINYGLILIFLTIVTVRLNEPFEKFNLWFYSTTAWVFRSNDKLSIFVPYFLITTTFLAFTALNFKKQIKIIILFLLLAPSFIFVIGGVQDYQTRITNRLYGYDYRFSVKIPEPYYQSAEQINRDSKTTTILSLPYSVVVSINWVNQPKWEFFGNDPTRNLFLKNKIIANSFDHFSENRLSLKEINDNPDSTKADLLKEIRKFSTEYVFWQKDITDDWLKDNTRIYKLLQELELDGSLNKTNSNLYFDLYQVNSELVLPMISSQAIDSNNYQVSSFKDSPAKLFRPVQPPVFSKTQLSFQKVNPTKYKVHLNLKNNTKLTLNQSYADQWALFLQKSPTLSWCKPLEIYNLYLNQITECNHQNNTFFEGEEISYLYQKPIFENTHTMAYDYANQWTIDPDYIKQNYDKSYYKENPDGSIDIEMTAYFKPQSYYYIGIILTFSTILLSSSYLIYFYLIKKKTINKKQKKDEIIVPNFTDNLLFNYQKTRNYVQNSLQNLDIRKINLVIKNYLESKKSSSAWLDLLKLGVILSVLTFSLVYQIGYVDSVILVFGLIAIIYGISSRVPVGLAMFGWLFTAIALTFKQDVLADKIVVKTFYFLIIALIIEGRTFLIQEVDSWWLKNKSPKPKKKQRKLNIK